MRPRLFVGRSDELTRLESALAGRGEVIVQAVHGLGGIGKSTLAARYAATHADDYNPIWWITADSPAAIESGLAGLATALQPELTQALPIEALAERATQWLTAHDDWLLILDNVARPSDVESLLARAAGGRFLITSRVATGWHRLASTLRLDVLDRGEAAHLLTRIVTGDRATVELGGVAELCEELGHLPLAIEQAAAYMHQACMTPRAYLEMLAKYPTVMYGQAAEGADAERTIARIWRITIDRLTDTPLAGQVLRILAWYASDHIPRTLLVPLAEKPQLQQAIGRLTAYSMVNTAGDGNTISVHRLVQAVARTPDPGDPHRHPEMIDSARLQAIELLDAATPGDWDHPASWPGWRILLPHVQSLTRSTPPQSDTDTAAVLFNRTGLFLHSQGNGDHAIPYLQRALSRRIHVLGVDHPDTLVVRNNLASAYESTGALQRAIRLYEQTLADCVRVLGDDHPFTLATRNNLARVYESTGALQRAINLFDQTLAEQRRVLGDDHPDTLASGIQRGWRLGGSGLSHGHLDLVFSGFMSGGGCDGDAPDGCGGPRSRLCAGTAL